jgi:excinuclease ABC subunit C
MTGRPPNDHAIPDDDLPPEAADAEEAAEDVAPLLSGSEPDEEASPASLARGAAAIRAHWKHAPVGPGVYRMIGADGEVLYVGKAKSVRKRIASYMRDGGHTQRIARMISATVSMVFVSTRTETEALLLETNLIKQLRPRFNVLMRDDKSFPYILLSADHPSPQLTKHRGARTRKGDYFGPFASVWAVNRTLSSLQRAFLVRTCSDSYFEARKRPCLLYQIKRCAGPCTGEIAPQAYQVLAQEARDFLSGKSRAVRERMAQDMRAAADAMEFETAARLRDRIAALSAIQGEQGINPQTVEEADVFAVVEQAGQFCVECFFFRTYQNWGNRAYFPRADRALSEAEVLDAFLAQFYGERPAPRLVLTSHEVETAALLGEALSERAGRKVEVQAPQRGEKRDLVAYALDNARETLLRRLAETATQEKLLAALALAFGVEGKLRRVEVYDNSHIMGTNAVGAMIVAGTGGFMKTHYRTFNIKGDELTPGDDFGMMREVLKRRFSRLAKERPVETAQEAEAFPDWPDLVLIDGGKGQLEAARGVMAEAGAGHVPVASIAKGPDRDAGMETFHVPGRDSFKLPPRDPALYFVQRLRDEAHRFAIGTHRARRKKEFVKSPLDEIAGIGPARKRALLDAFGTAKAIGRASLADLEKTPGVNKATARLVYAFFNERAS